MQLPILSADPTELVVAVVADHMVTTNKQKRLVVSTSRAKNEQLNLPLILFNRTFTLQKSNKGQILASIEAKIHPADVAT